MSSTYRPTIDHLGFTIESESDFRLYEQSQSEYFKILAKRSQRWQSFLRFGENKYNSAKLKRFIRKGIPNEYRPMIWMKVSGAKLMMKANPDLYVQLQSKLPPGDVVEAIDIDIPRTFPQNIYYKDVSTEPSLRPGLRRVLLAFAVQNPQIGYCQGLNYVAAIMLLVLRDDHKTFWLLNALTIHLLSDYYVRGPIAMKGLQVDLDVLSSLVKEHLPNVDHLMVLQKIDWGFVCTKWFVCLFIDTLPIETVLRIWDAFFNEGRKLLFRVALTLLKKGEVNIVSGTTIDHVMEAFQTVTRDTYTWYSHNFMQIVYKECGEIPSAYLKQLTKSSQDKITKQYSKK